MICLKNPVVLVHGLGARSTYGPVQYFYGLPRLLEKAGNRVFVPRLTAWHSIEHRAEQLKEQLEHEFPEGEKLNLIGHSMGGLDARYLASRMEFSDRVATVTTVGTPNHGSTMGDVALGLVPDVASDAIERLLSFLNSTAEGFRQCTRSHCTERFNVEVPNAPGVAYFSATSAIGKEIYRRALPIFWMTTQMLSKFEGDNDGFVSVESSRWGEHICTYTGDHYGQIGQILGYTRGLDHFAFFDEILKRLNREGF
jgi:triacylglycerol lipase